MMLKRIYKELDKLEPSYYHYQYRSYNFIEACLIVSGLAIVVALSFVGLALMVY